MADVIDFPQFRKGIAVPTLVLVGLHQNPDGSRNDGQTRQKALVNCRLLLDRARACSVPIAHARRMTVRSVTDRLRYPSWIPGFEPARSDMVFDLLQSSCYSNPEFSHAMDYSNGNFAIAGFFGETTCLSTAIDAHHRRHDFIYFSDASACHSNGAIPAHLFHAAISQVMSIYGATMRSEQWSGLLSAQRRLAGTDFPLHSGTEI